MTSDEFEELRKLAESKLEKFYLEKNSEGLSPEDTDRILHDLRVHQVELELQNEQLQEIHAKLNETQKYYFDLYDLAPVGYCTLDEQLNIIEANFLVSTLLGLERNILLKLPFSKFILAEDQDIYYFYFKQLFKTNKSESCELRIEKSDGTQLWIRLEGVVTQSESSATKEVRLVLSDITDRKMLSEMNLSQERELHDLYLTLNASAIVAFTDPKGNITYVNDKFCQVSQYERDELIGANHRILKSGFHTDLFYKELWKTISSGKTWTGEIKNRAKDGTFYWVMTTIVPFFDEQGKLNQYVSIRVDITKNKNDEAELVQSQIEKNVILEMIKERSKFIDIAAHELRTPITALSLLLQIAEKQMERGNPLTSDILAKLRRPTDRLTRLVVDLLDISRQERGLVVLLPVQCNLVSLITDSLEEFRIMTPKRNFIFNKPDAPIEINLDPLRINQVLSNLLDNAIKYTNEGDIEVGLVVRPDSVRVSVTDHGSGIPKEQRATLFEAFSRGKSYETFRAQGLGLGLAVCKGIMDLHHGSIGVRSVEGEGSTFYFDLPRDH
jgi:PAS domain S-box-containing protein